MIAILEPFSDNSELNFYKAQLTMYNASCNVNAKIWLFWNQDVDCKVLDQDDQQITCEIKHVSHHSTFINTFVYAKCRYYIRRPLWDNILQFSSFNKPWSILGDFNIIIDIDEKLGGQMYIMNKNFEIIGVIEACGLTDLYFHGQKFTWCNHKSVNDRIYKRLDRAMVNDKWLEIMPLSTITHLSSTSSDHCPLLLEIVER
ncbi:hypothetical protein P3L10_022717 [Capsicum annuum]